MEVEGRFLFNLRDFWNFPGGPEVRNPPVNSGDTGSMVQEDPTCLGTTKHMHHATEPVSLQSMLCNRRSRCDEKLRTAMESSSRWLQLEKAHPKQQRRSAAKNRQTKTAKVPELHQL